MAGDNEFDDESCESCEDNVEEAVLLLSLLLVEVVFIRRDRLYDGGESANRSMDCMPDDMESSSSEFMVVGQGCVQNEFVVE